MVLGEAFLITTFPIILKVLAAYLMLHPEGLALELATVGSKLTFARLVGS
jgi:hypothetical protein